MRGKLFVAACLIMLCTGCAASKPHVPTHIQETIVKEKVEKSFQETQEATYGYTLDEVAAFRPQSLLKCWQCADYIKKKRGLGVGEVPTGTTKRMCNPQWQKNTCSKKVMLGDASIWELTGNCRCDG